MRYFQKLLCMVLLLLCFPIFASCRSVDKRAQQRETRDGLESIVGSKLPESNVFVLIEVVPLDSSRTEYGMTCYYATDYLIMGTSMPESEALERYVEELLLLGWVLEGEQYPISKVLINGQNARIVVEFGDPGVDIRDAVDYDQLRNKHQSIIFIRVDFMLPNREDC